MVDGSQRPVFEVLSPLSIQEGEEEAQVEAGPALLGVWTTAPLSGFAEGRPTPAEGVAFDVAAAGPPVWRANLPADPDLAAAHLDRAEASLDISLTALIVAGERISVLVEERRRLPAGLAFDISETEVKLAQPEMELLALLEEVERGPRPVHFEAGEEVGGLTQVTAQFREFVDQLREVVTHYALVETRSQGQLLGQTAVDWTGDMDTVWQEGLDTAQMALHQRTLRLALASREMLIRMFTLVSSGAARLSVLLATPGGAILALPAAWKFINQVRDEIEKYQRITQEV